MTLPRRSSSIKRPFASHAASKGRAVGTAVPTPKTQVHDTTLFLALAFAPRSFSRLQNAFFPFLKPNSSKIYGSLSKGFYEPLTSTRSEELLLICLDAYQICIAECLILIETILPIILGKNTAHECKKSTFG